jgi:DNA (cytosine-5)-methyltransferase 1
VQTDLENQGYEVQAYILPACGKNAPHKRERTFFVAYSKLHENKHTNNGGSKQKEGNIRRKNEGNVLDTYNSNGIITNPISFGRGQDVRFTNGESNVINKISETGDVTNTNSKMFQYRNQYRKNGWDNTQIGTKSFDFTGKWETFPTQSPVCGGDDGLPRELDSITFSKWRNESIKAYGNAIVPQVAYEIFKAIQSFEDIVK